MSATAYDLSSERNHDYRPWRDASAELGYGTSSKRSSVIKHFPTCPGTRAAERDAKELNLLSKIADYNNLPDDWDGYGGVAASLATVLNAVHFLQRFPSTLPLPKPMIGGSGLIGLYWEGNGCYASIDFDGSGYYCYIADSSDEESGQDAVPVDAPLPQRLAEVIAMTMDAF